VRYVSLSLDHACVLQVANGFDATLSLDAHNCRSHAGARVHVLNTDAEGRMVLSDMLSHLREKVLNDKDGHPNAHLFTCATLTGHAARSVGPYTIAMDNGPAVAQSSAYSLQTSSTAWGDPIEVSLLRREDFQWAKPKTKKSDVLQMGSAVPAGARGHQYGATVCGSDTTQFETADLAQSN
jgi:leucyl aminopeptidase